MPYVIRAYDRPGSADLRQRTRAAHLAYLEPIADRILAAGGVTDDEGTLVSGSLIIVDTEHRSEAESIAANDPYALAGLFERVEIQRWRNVFFAGAQVD